MLRNGERNEFVHSAIGKKTVNVLTVYWKQTPLYEATFSVGR